MLRIELSALSVQELRRLLEVARARGQGPFVEQLEAELRARPTRAEDWAPAPMAYAQPLAFEPEEAPGRPRRNTAMAATAVLAAFVSAAVTWGLSVPVSPRPDAARPPAPQPPPRAAVVLASLAPVNPPVGFTEVPAAPAPEAVSPGPPAKTRTARAQPARRARENPCLDLPTAAERLVCGYPSLAAQDRQLRTAYDRALSAGVDRRELDRAQAVWRDGSETVADRQQLADRYTRRIRELESAAVRPPPPPPEEPPF